MTRTLNSPITAQRGEFSYLYEINHAGGVIRVTNATSDIVALGQTWTAVGGALVHTNAPDTPDGRSQGTDLRLWGVDQTIISAIQNNVFRGQLLRIYLIHFDPDTGVASTPDLIFQGRQNGDFTVSETRDFASVESGGRVEVRTRITADLASVNNRMSVRCNVPSHEEMLRRAGTATPDDKFFARVAAIMDKDVYWGTPGPSNRSYGGGYVPGTDGGDRRNWW